MQWKSRTSYSLTAGGQSDLERHPLIVRIPFIIANLTGCEPTFLAYRSAVPGALLAFHLKQSHTLLPDSFVGSIEITVDELRKLCERGERMLSCCLLFRNAAKVMSFQFTEVTLELQDKRNRRAARLIVRVLSRAPVTRLSDYGMQHSANPPGDFCKAHPAQPYLIYPLTVRTAPGSEDKYLIVPHIRNM